MVMETGRPQEVKRKPEQGQGQEQGQRKHEQEEQTGDIIQGPHITLKYKDKTVLDDATNLLIHHVKRQAGIHKEDKHRIKVTIIN